MKLKSYSAQTHQGPYLQVNEDDVDVDIINNLFLIFDGFGGSSVGGKAVSLLKESIKKFFTKIGGDPDSTLPFYYSHKYLLEGNALVNSMHYAHDILKKENEGKEMSSRGGASVIAGALAENILTFASTGNCLAYLYRKGHLEMLLAPDSIRSVAQDNYAPHFTTAPMSGFGLFNDIHLQMRELRVMKDDMILLLTDGVYARIVKDEVKFVMDKSNLSDGEKLQELFNLANTRGNLDNQSGMVLQF